MREVYPGIFMITETANLFQVKFFINIFVITGEDSLIFDAGLGTNKAISHFLKKIKEINSISSSRGISFSPDRIIISHTHPDHFSGLRKIRQALKLKVLLTENQAKILSTSESFLSNYDKIRGSINLKTYNKKSEWEEFLYIIKNSYIVKKIKYFLKHFPKYFYRYLYGIEFPGKPDEIIKENSRIKAGGSEWIILPAPGHSRDHISLYSEGKGILLAGDNVLRSITPWLGPPDSNLKDYLCTLNSMLKLPKLDIILPAHGGPVSEPKKRIKNIIDLRLKRINQVRNILKRNGTAGSTARSILIELYGYKNFRKFFLAEGWISLTLMFLEENGMAICPESAGNKIYIPTDKITSDLKSLIGCD
jgi:glyoxylase-like metal-dependent hydrolase (beta-lactamase superfamily II)